MIRKSVQHPAVNPSRDRRTRVSDVLVEMAMFLVIAFALYPVFGVVAGSIAVGAVGNWALMMLRGLRTHRRAGQPITTAVLRDAALLRLHHNEPPFRHARTSDLTRAFKVRRGGRDQ